MCAVSADGFGRMLFYLLYYHSRLFFRCIHASTSEALLVCGMALSCDTVYLEHWKQ